MVPLRVSIFIFIVSSLAAPSTAEDIAKSPSTNICVDGLCLSSSDLVDSIVDSPSLSLLQHKAKLTKASQIDVANATHEKHAVPTSAVPAKAKETAAMKKHASDAHKAHTGIVTLQPTLFFTTVQLVITLFLVGGVLFFFVSEKEAEKKGEEVRPVAKALDATKYMGLKEKVLQDFIPDTDAPFVLAVDGRKPLSFKQLRAFISSKEANVARFGVSGGDRLATILGDGPECVVAFWAFSAQCAFCPINHKASDEEIAFTLRDLPAKAVVIRREDAKRVSGIPIIEYAPSTEIAGIFTLSAGGKVVAPVRNSTKAPSRKSIALVIQTSGTTKKPKQVPLTHENIILCGKMITDMVKLDSSDRALNFLPLFHIGGIINSIVAPVMSQSSVVCGTHFAPAEVFGWILQHRPTWYFGSPTTHMLLMSGDQNPPEEPILKLIRNATAALLPSTATEMQDFWKGCDILPGYGMSECTPITSHQYGKEVRLASSGPGAGPSLSVDDKGEVLVKGPAVFSGYEVRSHMDEDPNIAAFDGGWFHTGDAGWLDSDGYLSITGRFKEIIIRGGENISPFDVEDAITDPLFKANKMAFSVRHEELGEVVGLAVETTVLDAQLGDAFKAMVKNTGLDNSKQPQVIVKMDALPKGLAGKMKRIGLQKKIGLPDISLARSGPIAYTYADGKLTALDVYADDAEVEVDSLGLAKKEGGAQIAPHVRHAIMSMYGAVAICVVSYHSCRKLVFPATESGLGQSVVLMMGGNTCCGMRWTMQAFMACASFLNCKEPFQPTRVLVLSLLYFAMAWPIPQLAVWFNYLISREPIGYFFVSTIKRWFVGVMVFSYVSFAVCRHLPYKGFQCFLLMALTLILMIFRPSETVLADITPAWFNYWFYATGLCQWFVWTGCIMVYFIVGHYGHEAWARIKAHPFSRNERVQRRMSIGCPILYLVFQTLTFCFSPDALLGQTYDNHPDFKWAFSMPFLDQFVGMAMIILLGISVRNAPKILATVGQCALGIYMGCATWFFTPVPILANTIANPGTVTPLVASFAIIIDHFPIIPPLQSVVVACVSFWPTQVLAIFAYVLLQVALIGIPFHKLYLLGLDGIDTLFKKVGLA